MTIGNTPLDVKIYSVESAPTKLNDEGFLEIIFCLQGSVRFSYAYEEFTLNPGEFVSVDRDAYYLYKGKDNRCASFTIDLRRYEERYPGITHLLFICEGMDEGTTGYPRHIYSDLKGLLISALREMVTDGDEKTIAVITDRIVDLFYNRFNIFYYHYKNWNIDQKVLDMLNEMNRYISLHLSEKISLKDLSKRVGISEGYISELFRQYSLGFRTMLGYLRASASEKYLLNTDMTITEISSRCGFSDPKYYYAAFRRWYLCTPRQFREKYVRTIPNEVEYLEINEIEELLDDHLKEHYREIFVSDPILKK